MALIGYERVEACPALYRKLELKDKTHDAAWYDDESNAHRRIHLLLESGETGVMGRDVFATYILVQVDDGRVVGNCKKHLAELKGALDKYETKWCSPCVSFVGGEISRTADGSKEITGKAQVDRFVERYAEHLGERGRKVPVVPSERYRAKPSMDAVSEAERKEMDGAPYRAMLGSASYIGRMNNPKIAQAVGDLSRHVSDYGAGHWAIMRGLGTYVAGAREAGLRYTVPEAGTRQLALVYDANWAGGGEKGRSTDAIAVFFYGNCVDWGRKLQGYVAKASFESELGGCARGCDKLKFVGAVATGMGIMLELPVPVYGDNEGVMNGLTNVTHGTSAKHIDIRMFWMKAEIERGIFEMMHVMSADNLADPMTKALAEKPLNRLMDDLMGHKLTDAGRRMRKGLYACSKEEYKNRMMTRPVIKLHGSFPGPDIDEYLGKTEFRERGMRLRDLGFGK